MSKTNCKICQRQLDTDIDTNYNVSWYNGEPSELLLMCETCYQAKEQKYLGNYWRIWKETEKEGVVWIKKDENDCYAGKKGQNGKILKQKDCSHCQPWKHNKDKEKCANCDKEIGDTKYFGNDGKYLCSMECVNIHNNKDKPATKKCFVCGKDISNEETLSSIGNGKGRKNYCSIECLKKETPSKNNSPQPEPPPKSQNNNKGMPTEIKIILGVSATFLIIIIGVIGVKIYKRSRQKTS